MLTRSSKATAWSLTFFIILLFADLTHSLAFAEEKPIGRIFAITGTVAYRTAEELHLVVKKGSPETKKVSFTPRHKTKFKQPVYAKDEFRTSLLSRVKIIFEDKNLLALGPNSHMQVASYLYNSEQKLRQGAINMVHGLSMYIYRGPRPAGRI